MDIVKAHANKVWRGVRDFFKGLVVLTVVVTWSAGGYSLYHRADEIKAYLEGRDLQLPIAQAAATQVPLPSAAPIADLTVCVEADVQDMWAEILRLIPGYRFTLGCRNPDARFFLRVLSGDKKDEKAVDVSVDIVVADKNDDRTYLTPALDPKTQKPVTIKWSKTMPAPEQAERRQNYLRINQSHYTPLIQQFLAQLPQP